MASDFATIREAKDAVLDWLRWYNRTACTRRWPMSARCSSKKTGLQLRLRESAHGLAMGYAFHGQGQFTGLDANHASVRRRSLS